MRIHTMRKGKKFAAIATAAIVGMLLFAFIGGHIVRLLWNWLLPQLFGWREITFWQALALLALCRILFGGSGILGSNRAHHRYRFGPWEKMTPEERERVRQAIRERAGYAPVTDAAPRPE
jgi:MFS family permease